MGAQSGEAAGAQGQSTGAGGQQSGFQQPNAQPGAPQALAAQAAPTTQALLEAGGLDAAAGGEAGAADGGEVALASQSTPAGAARADAASPSQSLAQPRMAAAALMAFAQKITRNALSGATSFQIRIDPPEMGRVDVSLTLSADRKVRAMLTVEKPEALADLTRNAKALEQALADAGLELDAGGLQFSLDQGAQGRGEERAAPGLRQASAQSEAEETPAPRAERWTRGRIDLSV
jgi:flagellar hook-length control protein FliK